MTFSKRYNVSVALTLAVIVSGIVYLRTQNSQRAKIELKCELILTAKQSDVTITANQKKYIIDFIDKPNLILVCEI